MSVVKEDAVIQSGVSKSKGEGLSNMVRFDVSGSFSIATILECNGRSYIGPRRRIDQLKFSS